MIPTKIHNLWKFTANSQKKSCPAFIGQDLKNKVKIYSTFMLELTWSDFFTVLG